MKNNLRYTQSEATMMALRRHKQNKLPEDGSWVIIRGNPFAPRGLRIPDAIRAEGVKHFDIYYAYEEECPWPQVENKVYFDDNGEPDIDINNQYDPFVDISMHQITWMMLHTPSSRHIRMYSGEVSPISKGLLEELIAENYVAIRSFSKNTNNPVWDEVTRDMIGSLMLDGLSEQQAQSELIRAGEKFDRKWSLPNYYYEPIGDFRETFSEEPEYEEWWKDKDV